MLKRMAVLGIVLVGLCTVFGSILAQSNEIILTIAIEEWQQDMLNERVLQGFYDTHPGVKIVPVLLSGDETYFGFDTTDIEATLDKAEAYFSRADVLMARDYNLYPIYTRAGYVLDLTPYIRADGSGAIDDFYPIALKVFEWDNGLWALPAALRLNFISYSAEAFDAAGYPHPDSSWTLDDYIAAGRALTVRDDSGNVTLPGFYGFDERALVRALLGRGFYDSSTQPETVVMNDPEIEAMLESLDAYNLELVGDDPQNSTAMQNWDWSKIPLQMGGSWLISDDMGRGNAEPYVPVLFPGDSAIVSGEGFAISAGTQYPDLAYELIMYLTSDIEIVSRFYSEAPARRSLEGQTSDNFGPMPTSEALDEILPLIMENGIPASEMRYGEYLWAARSKMAEDEEMTLHEALQQAQEQAVTDFQAAEARKTTETIIVSTPVPTPVLSAGEVALKFMLQTNYSPTPNKDEWERIAQEFTDADAEVGYIEFTSGYRSIDEEFQEIDCAYTSYNFVPFIDLSLIQPLDPFLSTDMSFDRSDIPDLIWPLVTREEQVYGLPITLMPLMMWYNPKDFEAAGLFPPQMGWTISEFIDAMTMLKDAQPDSKPYRSQSFGNAPYVLLAAGLGGVAIDYSTYMPTYNLTDPAVVEALRQTLDLAKDGYIDYTELDNDSMFVSGGGGGGGGTGPTMYDAPGYIYNWEDIGTEFNPHIPVTFPRGSDLIPLSYNIGAAYITSHTPYAEACYRWLSTIAQHPELYNEMPVRRSFATNEALIAIQGQQASDFYVGMFDLIDSPQAVMIPAGMGGGNTSPGAYIADMWFNKAIDAYVLEDADLETALEDAQTQIDEYRACTADIPEFDQMSADQEAWEAHYKLFTDCAISIDPSLAPRFAPPEEED